MQIHILFFEFPSSTQLQELHWRLVQLIETFQVWEVMRRCLAVDYSE